MQSQNYLLSIDQGTTSSRAIIFDQNLAIASDSQLEFEQIYPQPGWVEHDPAEIWQSTLASCQKAIKQLGLEQAEHIRALGITNQRETTLVWDRDTGQPVYNAIVWQDRRTASICEQLRSKLQSKDGTAWLSRKTGLLLDPYFSATKIAWILDNVEGARDRANRGELAFGTVDTYLIWMLTGGDVHATDVTNASRTNLFNIRSLSWDKELLELFDVPESLLPVVKDCADDYGICDSTHFGHALPIRGVAGDQQAAAIGQRCFERGSVKSTYGTGCFLLVNTGRECLQSRHQLLSTIAYRINGTTHYALEGSIFVAGAAIQWLRDGIRVIDNAAETEALASGLDSNQGVYLVPAFTGLGAPYWEAEVKGAIFGLTRATGPAEFARAALESIAYLTNDLLEAVAEEGIQLTTLKVDGGMVANNWFTQFLTDILEIEVHRPAVLETTAVGAAVLAGISVNLISNPFDDAKRNKDLGGTERFSPGLDQQSRANLLSGWRTAMQKTLGKEL